MNQKLVTDSPEKTQRHVESRETNPDSAQSFQSGVHPVAQLQRTLGNRNVAKLIQAKRLTAGGKIIGLQRKLTVGAADDRYEQEADRVARQVMNTSDAMATASAERASSYEGTRNQTLQAKLLAAAITPVAQRQKEKENKEDKDREEEEEKEPIQTKSAGALSESFDAGGDVETQLGLSKGRGSPLPDPIRAYMEPRFGVDFSHVHVHTGSEALQMNQAVGAQAFTHGSDIYFGAGHSPANLELTAHELTHVIQQTGSPPLQKKERERGKAPPIPDPSIQRICAACAVGEREEKEVGPIEIQRKPVLGIAGYPTEAEPAIAKAESGRLQASSDFQQKLYQSKGSGTPLPKETLSSYEPAFGADFSKVIIHTGTDAVAMNKEIGARAFTHGSDIYFNEGMYDPTSSSGKQLLAHELTHTVQQGASTLQTNKQTGGPGSDYSKANAPNIQADWSNVGIPFTNYEFDPSIEGVKNAANIAKDVVTDFGETQGWMILREFAPAVVPIVQKGPEGIFDWLKESAGTAVEGVFDSLMSPVRAVSGVGQQLFAQFAPMLASIQEAGVKIEQNDCTPLREAAEKIETTAGQLITPIVEKLQPVVAGVKDFLSSLWEKIGAPIWDWIKDYASAKWAEIMMIVDQIQAAAKWIWDNTEWVRSIADQAWTWFKNKLGIGEGVEGQDGILQWVQQKLEAAWNVLKAKLEPFKRELTAVGTAVGEVALALSPAGPVLAIGNAVAGAAQGLRWIYTNWGKGDMVVQARVYLEKILIPSLQGAANRLGAAIVRMADSITGALVNFAAGLVRAVGSLGDSLLGVAVSAVQWITDQVTSLADWAQLQLGQLSQWMTSALDKFQLFLQQMLAFFEKVGNVVLDIWGLPVLLGEQVWNWVPACIRDPIVDFLGPIILRQIEIFQELVKDNDAWQKTKTEVGKIIRLVFTDHDLMGAIKATFYLILQVFNLPPDLLTTVAQKALSAWDIVIKKPLDFIKNTVRALGHGFKLLWANIGAHLEYGVQGWLFGELKEKNISPPEKWTDLKSVFFFVLDVLGLNVDHIFELLNSTLLN